MRTRLETLFEPSALRSNKPIYQFGCGTHGAQTSCGPFFIYKTSNRPSGTPANTIGSRSRRLRRYTESYRGGGIELEGLICVIRQALPTPKHGSLPHRGHYASKPELHLLEHVSRRESIAVNQRLTIIVSAELLPHHHLFVVYNKERRSRLKSARSSSFRWPRHHE